MVYREFRDKRELEGRSERRDHQDPLEPLADKETAESLASLELWEKPDLWDHLESGVSKESPDAREMMAYLDHKGHLDHPALLAQ